MTPNINTVNPPMTETISNANAAASTLFLGQNGEWWDFWLIVSVIAAAFVATAIGVTTAGSIISHKRESVAAKEALDRYKLDTGKTIAEANARQKQAELELLQLRFPRSLDIEKFEAAVKKIPAPAEYEVLYDANAPDALFIANLIWGIFFNAKWPTQQTTGAAPLKAPPPNILPYANLPWTQAAGGGPWGLSVVTTEPPDLDKNSLGSALVQALLECVKGPPSQVTLGYQTSEPLPSGGVRIIIGPKLP